MDKELTIKSKFYQQEDVVEVDSDEVDNLINEEIEEGNINVVSGKLYRHYISLHSQSFYSSPTFRFFVIDRHNTPYTSSSFETEYPNYISALIHGGYFTAYSSPNVIAYSGVTGITYNTYKHYLYFIKLLDDDVEGRYELTFRDTMTVL